MKLDTSTDPQVGYRPVGVLAAAPLERYRGPFGERQAAHLLRRSGFGGTSAEVARLSALGVDAAVDGMLHPGSSAADLPAGPDPDELHDVHLRIKNHAAQMWWLNRMLHTQHPLGEKMALFWHGHFATSLVSSKVTAPQMVAQINLFQATGLGDFRSLLRAVTYDPAMLVWLDNRKNVATHPNENYARELMELFTLGLGNYTEDDVKNAARALTGIVLQRGEATFDPQLHDAGRKTFLGRSGTFGPDDIVDIVVQQPAHPLFISRKLLEFFVYSDPEPELVADLAKVYSASGLHVGKTVEAILRSNVFFSSRAYRALTKSPIEFVIGLQRYMEFPAVPLDTVTWLGRMGQVPLMPRTVKGWDGGPTWINTTTMLARMNYVNEVVQAQTAATGATNPKSVPMSGTTLATMPRFPSNLTGTLQPDAIVARASGLVTDRILDAVVGSIVQHDVTSDVRAGLHAYLEGVNTDNPQPFGPETYQTRTRGLLALAFTLPSNQLN